MCQTDTGLEIGCTGIDKIDSPCPYRVHILLVEANKNN